MESGTTESLPRVVAPSLVGRLLASRYELFDDVGSGGITCVFRAWDHQLSHTVAVKILDRRLARNEEIVDVFEREARRAAALPTHRNIASVHDIGRDESLPYIVTELVQGRTLKEIIATEAPLPIDRAFDICRQIAGALEFAHQYGMVHGDVKPQNILLSADGRVRVTDFGFGHVARAAEGMSLLNPMGRAHYLSPEEALGREIEVWSDVYSLGVMLFEMLTGELPFRAHDPQMLARKQAFEQPPDPRRFNPALPPAVARIVLRALAKDPHNRYRNSAAVASALHEYLLLEAGATSLRMPLGETTRKVELPQAEPAERASASPSEQRRVVPIQRRHDTPASSRRLSFPSMVFLITLAIACLGGWLAYRGVSRATSGWRTEPVDNLDTPAVVHRHQAKHAAQPKAQPRPATTQIPANAASGCSAHHVGPVRFLRMWAEETQAHPGGPITFDYTIANDSSECRDALLGLTAVSDTQPGSVFRDPSAERVAGVTPGIHIYKRQFTFPPTAAGQRFDMVLTVTGPSKADTYGVIRVNQLIAVTP